MCFPRAEAGIDWNRTPEFLEQELREQTPESDLGPQRVDQLIRVWRLDGVEQWVLLHIEVQSQPDRDLAKRLYQYHSRLTERHGWPVTTLCVLADTSAGFRPEAFTWEFWDCGIRFWFPTCKLIDFPEPGLAASPNPLALVIRAHLAGKRTRLEEPLRYELKRTLLRELADRGFSREDRERLLRLIDWLIRLPKTAELDFRREMIQYFASKRMPYITSFERIAKEEGREEGRIEAKRASILQIVELRHGALPDGFPERLVLINDKALLQQVFNLALISPSLSDFDAGLYALGI
jgi:hypothetical protein